MRKYKSDREVLADVAEACGLPVWAKDVLDAPHSGIIDDGPKTKVCLIALALRSDERDELLERLTINDAMISRALSGFDCSSGDLNDYKRRMKFALEAALNE